MGAAIARMIEVAEHNNAWQDDTLIVLDALATNPHYGVRLEVSHTSGVPGWHAYCRDGVGTGHSVWVSESLGREEAVRRALDGYLDIRNNGI
jgi:hypothetical protein